MKNETYYEAQNLQLQIGGIQGEISSLEDSTEIIFSRPGCTFPYKLLELHPLHKKFKSEAMRELKMKLANLEIAFAKLK